MSVRKFYPKPERDVEITRLENEAALKRKIGNVRADAKRALDEGRRIDAIRLTKIADDLSQRDLFKKPKRKRKEQFKLW